MTVFTKTISISFLIFLVATMRQGKLKATNVEYIKITFTDNKKVKLTF